MNNLMSKELYLFWLLTSGNEADISILLKKNVLPNFIEKFTDCLNEMFQKRRLLLHQMSTLLNLRNANPD